MPPPTPASGEKSSVISSAENVAFIASAAPGSPGASSTVTPPSKEPVQIVDPLGLDGTLTVKSGGVPPTAWQSSAEELAKLLVGKQLGAYVIEESLGTGAMAAVFRAYDASLDRPIALKILPPVLAAIPEHVQRFEREAKAAGKLDSEHIARVHHYGQDQGLHYIAYEFVEGINLRTLLERNDGRLPVAEAVSYITQTAIGLAHAAQRGVVHRDIKPSNLVITPTGAVKLVDLGLARSVFQDDQADLTQSGATLGTFDYLAPEQAIDPRMADVRSDIYSLGSTFYHCLTGRPPVPQGTAARKLHSHQLELPPDPRTLNPEVPEPVVLVLSRMLTKKPEDRYQSAEELVHDLRKVQPDSTPSKDIFPQLQANPEQPVDSPWYLGVLGLALLIAGILSIEWLLTQEINPIHQASAELAPETGKAASTLPQSSTKLDQNPPPPVVLEIRTSKELMQALVRPEGGTLFLKEPVYEFRVESSDVLPIVISKGEWHIKPAEGVKPLLRFFVPSAPQALTSLFRVTGGSLSLHQAAFEIVEPKTESRGNEPVWDQGYFKPNETRGQLVAGFSVQQGGELHLIQCELMQTGQKKELTSRTAFPQVTMIQVSPEGASSSPAIVRCLGCLWHGGDVAVEQLGPSLLLWEDCWAGYYQQLFVLPALAGAQIQRRVVSVKQCCVLLPAQACFQLMGSQPILLEIERSIFSRPQATSSPTSGPGAWLVQDESTPVDIHSNENYFHRIPIYLIVEKANGAREVRAREWTQLSSQFRRLRDLGSQTLTKSPWMDARPWQRYTETGQLSALTLKEEYRAWGPHTLLGQTFPAASVEAQNAQITAANDVKEQRTLIVDGRGEDPGTFSTLNSALGSITDERETVIVLQVPGTVPMKPAEIGNSRVIIRAGDGYSPELVFHRDTVSGPEGDALLFKVHDGEITFENMRIRIEALRDPARSLAVAALSGVGKCTLKNSLISLKGDGSFSGVVCTIIDPTGMMSPSSVKSARTGVARLEVHESFIRGSGELLHVQTSRPFAATVQQTGIALDGTAFVMDGNRADMTLPAEQTAQLQIDHSTIWTTKGLLYLHGTSSMPQLVPLRSQISHCLISTGDAFPMIRIEANQIETDLKRRLSWMGKRNCYVAPGQMMTCQSLDRESMAIQHNSTAWSEYWGGDDEQAQMVKSLMISGMNRPGTFVEWEPTDLIPRIDSGTLNLRDVGVPVEQLPSVRQASSQP